MYKCQIEILLMLAHEKLHYNVLLFANTFIMQITSVEIKFLTLK